MTWIVAVFVSIFVFNRSLRLSKALSDNAMAIEDYTVMMFRWSDILKIVACLAFVALLFFGFKAVTTVPDMFLFMMP